MMRNEFDWKKFQFITEVQNALINNAINTSLSDDATKMRHIISATGTLINMDDAYYTAERIPKDVSAHQAACKFVEFACENLRPEGQEVPYWFARH